MSAGTNKDEGKLRLDLVAPEAIEALARVSTQAVESGKYPDRDWEKGMKWSRQYASAMRHLMAWQRGEDIDPESGLPHLEHALWRIAALVTYARRRIGEDDRPSPDNHDVHVELSKQLMRDYIADKSPLERAMENARQLKVHGDQITRLNDVDPIYPGKGEVETNLFKELGLQGEGR